MSELVIDEDYTLWSRGRNGLGQLGLGSFDSSFHRNFTKCICKIKSVACSGRHACCIRTDGSMWSTGSYMNGELGDGQDDENDEFDYGCSSGYDTVSFKDPTNYKISFSKVFCREGKTLAIDEFRNLFITGGVRYDGIGLYRNQFEKFESLSDIVDCDISKDHCFAIDTEGFIWRNINKFDNINVDERCIFQKIEPYNNFFSVCFCKQYVFILDIDSNLWMGNVSVDPEKFYKIKIDKKFKQISSGHDRFVALERDGTAWSFDASMDLDPSCVKIDLVQINTVMGCKFLSISVTHHVISTIDINGFLWSSLSETSNRFDPHIDLLQLCNIKNVRFLANEKPIIKTQTIKSASF